MIIAVEGVDCSGKSTLFAELQKKFGMHFRCIPRVKCTPADIGAMAPLDRQGIRLWAHMYEPGTTYLVDRHFSVSMPVYNALYGRPVLDVSAWRKYVCVLYTDTPIDELRRRYAARGDTMFHHRDFVRTLELYEEQLRLFPHVFRVLPTTPVSEVVRCMTSWWLEQDSSARLSPAERLILANGASSSSPSPT